MRAEPKQNHSEQCLCLSQSQTEIQGQKTVSKNQIAGLWCVQSKLKGLQVQKVVCNWKGSLNQCICHDSYRVYINTRRTRLTVTMGFHCPAVSLLVSVTLIRSCIGDVLRTRIAQLLDNIPHSGRRAHVIVLSVCTAHTSAGGYSSGHTRPGLLVSEV